MIVVFVICCRLVLITSILPNSIIPQRVYHNMSYSRPLSIAFFSTYPGADYQLPLSEMHQPRRTHPGHAKARTCRQFASPGIRPGIHRNLTQPQQQPKSTDLVSTRRGTLPNLQVSYILQSQPTQSLTSAAAGTTFRCSPRPTTPVRRQARRSRRGAPMKAHDWSRYPPACTHAKRSGVQFARLGATLRTAL